MSKDTHSEFDLKALAEQGWLGLAIPEKYGGTGGGFTDLAILLEETGRAMLDLALWIFRIVTYGGQAILRDGTEEQRRRFLPGVAKGECIFCFGLTEPDAGSDAASITTFARVEDDHFVVNGRKMFTSGMAVSDYCMLVVRTDRSAEKHRGISVLAVDCKSPGITMSPIDVLCHWPIATYDVVYEDVRVPKENLVGPLHGGWAGVLACLEVERLCLSAARMGAAQDALDQAIAYATARHQFGRPIGKFQAVSHKIADMDMMVEVSRVMTYRYAWLLGEGRATRRDTAHLKLYSSEAYRAVADMALQVFGGMGLTMECDVQRHFRDARLGTIGAGTSEIQRNIIARELGL
ncbi:MAG: acyl-CoA dehydrogenase family protein, partial [Nitrospinota bacterium]